MHFARYNPAQDYPAFAITVVDTNVNSLIVALTITLTITSLMSLSSPMIELN